MSTLLSMPLVPDVARMQEVCSGTTGACEVVQMRFNPAVVSFNDLLDVFW